MRTLLCLGLLTAVPVFAEELPPDVDTAAKTYLDALTGKGADSGKDLLLGGATATAQLFSLENWKIITVEPAKKEEGDVPTCVKLMADLDKAARAAIGKLMGTGTTADASDGLGMQEVSQADALKLMLPTQDKAKRFLKSCPVLAKALKVGKEVYFHPKNPMRMVMGQAGRTGKYSITYYRIVVQSKEGPRQAPRDWPLHLLRFKTPKIDTGWKVLPASDWGGE